KCPSIAESKLYRSWGCDVIGMPNMPDAKLAREAEICYVTVAMVTDFDCWDPDHDHVQLTDMMRVLLDNVVSAARPAPCSAGGDRALEHVLITTPTARSLEMVKKLNAVAGRVLGGSKSP